MANELLIQKMGSMKKFKAALKRGGGSGMIQGVPADGITVRFLTEPDEWVGYWEWFDKEANQFVPMVKGEDLPNGTKPSHRFLANAVIVSDGPRQDTVVALKLAKTLATSLGVKGDKYGTLTDRDYELDKYGEGFDTTYDVTPDAPSKRNLTKYELLDLEAIIMESRAAIDGTDDDDADDDEPVKPLKGGVKGRGAKRATVVEPDDDEDEIDEDDELEDDDDDDDDEPTLESESDVEFDLGETIEAADFGDDDAIASMEAWWTENGDESINPDDFALWSEAVAKLEMVRKRAARKTATAKKTAAPAKKAAAKPSGKPAAKTVGRKRASAPVEPEPEDDEDEDESSGSDELEVDLETLTAMSLSELRGLADEFGVAHKGLSKSSLVRAIMDAAEE
jgi:hypothetical protein